MPSKRTTTIKDLQRINVLNEPQMSPDGKSFVFVRQFITEDEEYTSHLFVQGIEDSSPVQWTFGDGKVMSPRFSPDGKWLAFISVKGTDTKPQLFLISTSGGSARPITDLPGGALEPVWSPDSQKILFSTSFKKGAPPENGEKGEKTEQSKEKPPPLVVERLKYKSDAAGFHNEKNKQLAVYSINGGQIDFITDDDVDHTAYAWNSDSKTVSFSANKHGDAHIVSDLYLLDSKTREQTQLTDGTGIFTHGNFSPDGKKIACLGHEKEYAGATHTKVWLIDLETKERQCLSANRDIHMMDAAMGDIRSGHPNPGPVWASDGESVYALASENGNTDLYNISVSKEIIQLTHGKHHVFGFHVHEASDVIITGVSTPVNPGEIFLTDCSGSDLKQITDFNKPFLDSVRIIEPEEITAESKDGLKIHGWLLKPADYKEGHSYPGILEIHGGPHAMYGHTFFHELQLLAAEGFAVFYANPRGSYGYGQSFVNACRGDYGGMDYEDIMAFTDEVLRRYNWIDEKRLGVTGGSYGGFMTNWIVSHTSRFKAAATLRCISNWISFYGVSDIGYFFTEWEIGADFLHDPDKLWKHSPLKYVNSIETPLLIMHGEKDFRCPVEQAEQLFTALKQQKKDTRFVRFPDANHELSRSGPPYLRTARLKELTSWFHAYLD